MASFELENIKGLINDFVETALNNEDLKDRLSVDERSDGEVGEELRMMCVSKVLERAVCQGSIGSCISQSMTRSWVGGVDLRTSYTGSSQAWKLIVRVGTA